MGTDAKREVISVSESGDIAPPTNAGTVHDQFNIPKNSIPPLQNRNNFTVNDLVAAIPEGETLAYNSVLTTIRILEQKGYVEHRQEGRAFIYRACVAEAEASRTEVRHVLSRFFGNSRERLLLSLLGDDDVSPEELERLKDAIRSAEPDSGSEV